MTKNLRKYISVILIFTMIFTLASCKGAGDVVDMDTEVNDNGTEEDIDIAEPVEEDDPLYANAALAARNAYEVKTIASPHGDNGYYVKGGKTGNGVYYIFQLTDEYNNSAFFAELYDNAGSLNDSFLLSKPVGIDRYESEKTDVVEANEDIKGIRFEFPDDLLKEYRISCDSVDDVSYSCFNCDSDGSFESLLTIWGYDSRGDYLTEYFNGDLTLYTKIKNIVI